MTMMPLDYTVVIATRNRPVALRLSIPRILGQSRPPAQLIVVDASDDHLAVVAVVKKSLGNHPVELTIIASERGLTRQRNASLGLIKHPVVFFPDDDSIWFPDAAAIQMDVYERDREGRIAAVCAAESQAPPADWNVPSAEAYQMRLGHRIQQQIAAKRARFQNSLFPDPAKILGRSCWPPMHHVPAWFRTQDIVLVEYMTGFRMSFRTDVIRAIGFDEVLKGYSLCEDIDASIGAWMLGWVVAARRAKVFHYRSPESRDNAKVMGITQVLNKAYVIVKRTQPNDPFRCVLHRFIKSKEWIAKLTNLGPFGRARLQGIKAAVSQLPPLLHAPPETARDAYNIALQMAVAQSEAAVKS